MRSRLLIAGALALVLLGVGATPAQGQVRIGAPLNLPANEVEGCELVVFPSLRPIFGVPPSCTFYGLDAGGAWSSQVPRGRWVINRARVRTGPRVGPMVITIIRAMRSQAGVAGIICCSTPVESQPFTPQPNQVNQVNVQLPVQNAVNLVDGERVEVVDYLAVSPLTLQSSAPLHRAVGGPGSSANTSYIAPAIRAGQERLSDGSFPGTTPLVNADLVPCPGTRSRAASQGLDASTLQAGCPPVFAVSGVRRNARRGIARLIVAVPRAGTVTLRASRQVRGANRKTSRRGTVRIPVRPRGKLARDLSQANVPAGKRRPQVARTARVTLVFNPNRGNRTRLAERVRLVRRR